MPRQVVIHKTRDWYIQDYSHVFATAFFSSSIFLDSSPALYKCKYCSKIFSIHGYQTARKQAIQGKQILLFKILKMFNQDRKYFHSRFRPALLIAFLLFSPTEDPSRNEFLKSVQEEVIYIKDFLDKQNEEQWKHVNTANIVKEIDRLMKKLSHYANVLDELTNSIHKDIKQRIHHRTWYLTSGFVGGVISASLLSTGHPVAIFVAYFSGVAFVGYCYEAYKSACETLQRSRLLQNNTREIRREVAKYRSNLEIMKMRIDSECSSLSDDNS